MRNILAARLVRITDNIGEADTNLFGHFAYSDEELRPGRFEVINILVGLDWQILEDPPLLEMAEKSC